MKLQLLYIQFKMVNEVWTKIHNHGFDQSDLEFILTRGYTQIKVAKKHTRLNQEYIDHIFEIEKNLFCIEKSLNGEIETVLVANYMKYLDNIASHLRHVAIALVHDGYGGYQLNGEAAHPLSWRTAKEIHET